MNKYRIAIFLIMVAVGLTVFVLSCDEQTKYIYIDSKGGDTIPPSTITNLTVIDTGYTNLGVAFTVPEDDGGSTQIPYIILKKHKGDFSGFIWDQAETVFDNISYVPPGAIAGHQISNLEMGATYTIGVKAYDEEGNYSELSNLVQVTTNIGAIDTSGFYVGDNVWGISVADFDNNGYLDILTADYQSIPQAVIFRNLGNGEFVPPEYITSVGMPMKFVSDDFDKDGKVDFAISNFMANQTAIHLSKNDFHFPLRLYTSTRSHSLVSADFDHNGYPDIAAGNYDYGTITVFLNNNGETFQEGDNYATGTFTRGVFAGDLNGDSFADLVAASDAGHNLSVRINNGSGNFSSFRNYNLAGGGAYVDGGDFDDDGDIDLAVAVYAGDTSRVLVMFNDGNGLFDSTVAYLEYEHLTQISVGDMDNDNDLDLVVTKDHFGTGLIILRNNGSGVFNLMTQLAYPANCSDLALADMNNDNKLDMVVINDDNDKVVIVDNPF